MVEIEYNIHEYIFVSFMATIDSPTCLEGEDEVSGIQLVAIVNLTGRCH